ncbi:MAG: tRNA lysidine(34) synthetase TilS [Candidatus Riflebacteria bacterium]|nr:tRNA lysidine(34) synthetase TilS [Candidatus Riflebacteria bacterium]
MEKSLDHISGIAVSLCASLLKRTMGRLPGLRIGVAVSGGADSVALLLLLNELSLSVMPSVSEDINGRHLAKRLELHVLHVDHAIRPDSKTDATWVSALARSLGLPFHTCRLVPPAPDRIGREGGIEAWARRERLTFFSSVSREANLDAIATGHHTLDQAETILLRLIRGTSLPGLGGIRPHRRLVVRGIPVNLWSPLLAIRPDELRTFLRECGQSWREDISNQDKKSFLRNRVRHDLLPMLEELRPGAADHLVSIANDMAEAQSEIVHRARRRLNKATDDFLPVSSRIPTVLLRELLRLWWFKIAPEAGERFDRRLLNRLVDLVRRSECGRRVIAAKHTIVRVADGIRVLSPTLRAEPLKEASVTPSFDNPVKFAGFEFTARKVEPNFSTQLNHIDSAKVECDVSKSSVSDFVKVVRRAGATKKYMAGRGLAPVTHEISLSPNISPQELCLRHPAPGDRIAPAHGNGSKKLSRLLIDRKVPVDDRASLVVLAHGTDILWVIGIERSRDTADIPDAGWWSLSCLQKNE